MAREHSQHPGGGRGGAKGGGVASRRAVRRGQMGAWSHPGGENGGASGGRVVFMLVVTLSKASVTKS